MHSVIGGNQPNKIEICDIQKSYRLIYSCKKNTTQCIRFRSMINDHPVMAESSFSLFFYIEHTLSCSEIRQVICCYRFLFCFEWQPSIDCMTFINGNSIEKKNEENERINEKKKSHTHNRWRAPYSINVMKYIDIGGEWLLLLNTCYKNFIEFESDWRERRKKVK